jgi:ABC-type lipoprotein release transport system permease subunit
MMIQTIKMAWRDLGRNRRRSFFSALALGIGLALLLLIASVLNGEMRGAMDISINLQSGHLQVRAKTYNFDTLTLDWQDLIENPNSIAQQVAALEPVKAASPRLFASGIVASGEQSAGVRIFGVDTASTANAPFQEGVIEGSYLNNDDREGVLMGQELAKKMGLKAGDTINLLVNTANGDVDEQRFVIRGLYTTRTPPFDESTLIMPIAKAQAISGAGDRASAIFVLLNDLDQTDAVVNALQSSQYQLLTWRQLNDVLVQTEELSRGYMILIYLIVLAITATVIVNTLVMAVFERTREIGILTAIGMKGRHVMAMFFAESALLAIGGILMGLILGGIIVWYFTNYGFYIGNMGLDESVMIGERIYAYISLNDAITLSLLALIVTLLAALYPALLAARMEPVVALRGGE